MYTVEIKNKRKTQKDLFVLFRFGYNYWANTASNKFPLNRTLIVKAKRRETQKAETVRLHS